MRIPKSISILGRKYTVKVVSEEFIVADYGSKAFAVTDFQKKRILILEGMSEEDNFIALAHEMIHCVLVTTGLSQIIPKKIHEIICESCANGFLDLIRGIHG